MLKEERHQKLLKVLAEKEFATVEELSKSLLVSMPTIRRDLTELARRKLIIRNHGVLLLSTRKLTISWLNK